MSGVNNVTNTTTQAASYTSQTNNNSSTQGSSNVNENKTEVAKDEYSGSVPKSKTGNYTKDGVKVDLDMINEARANMKNNAGAFKAMVEGMNKSGRANGLNNKDANSWSDFVTKQLGKQYSVAEAQSLVADDGYWGVEQTSQRIVDMAKSLSGGDMKQYDKLMSAIEKGFGAAKDAWGGKMPDITSKTYDAVMEKMKAWKEEASNTTTQQAVTASEGVAK